MYLNGKIQLHACIIEIWCFRVELPKTECDDFLVLKYRDCAIPYVGHFHTGYGIFHSDLAVAYLIMLH